MLQSHQNCDKNAEQNQIKHNLNMKNPMQTKVSMASWRTYHTMNPKPTETIEYPRTPKNSTEIEPIQFNVTKNRVPIRSSKHQHFETWTDILFCFLIFLISICFELNMKIIIQMNTIL